MMQRVVLILPDEEKRLPGVEKLRRAGFLVSTALDRDVEQGEVTRGEQPPGEKRTKKGGTDGEDAP